MNRAAVGVAVVAVVVMTFFFGLMIRNADRDAVYTAQSAALGDTVGRFIGFTLIILKNGDMSIDRQRRTGSPILVQDPLFAINDMTKTLMIAISSEIAVQEEAATKVSKRSREASGIRKTEAALAAAAKIILSNQASTDWHDRGAKLMAALDVLFKDWNMSAKNPNRGSKTFRFEIPRPPAGVGA